MTCFIRWENPLCDLLIFTLTSSVAIAFLVASLIKRLLSSVIFSLCVILIRCLISSGNCFPYNQCSLPVYLPFLLLLASKKNWLREDYRHKLHVALTSRTLSEDLKKRISESTSGEKNHFYGKTHSYTDTYRQYRNQLLENGIPWNLFQKLMSHGQRLLNANMFTYIRCVLGYTEKLGHTHR